MLEAAPELKQRGEGGRKKSKFQTKFVKIYSSIFKYTKVLFLFNGELGNFIVLTSSDFKANHSQKTLDPMRKEVTNTHS